MKIRIATFINISPIFNFEPVSLVPHSVKYSWFLSEFIVLKVEIEDRNLVIALLRKILGSDGKSIDFCFNIHQKCMVSRMHFFKFVGESSHSVSQRLRRLLSSLNLWLCLRFGFRPQFSGACAIDRLNRFGFRPQFTPSNMFINPSLTERD